MFISCRIVLFKCVPCLVALEVKEYIIRTFFTCVSIYMSTYSRNVKLILGGVCSLGIGFAPVNLLPNTFFIDKLQEVVEMYRNGLPVPITEEVSKQFVTVMNDMQINSESRELIHPFTVYGYDMFNASSIHSKFGTIVGIPSNFNYKGMDDVETDKITVSIFVDE